MNILVIGGTGFIASHIVEALLEEDNRIRIIDRTIKYCFEDPDNRVEYMCADYGDQKILKKALKNIDCVIHLASSTVPGTSNENPIADIENNLINSVRLLEEMNAAGVKKIIYFSSGGTVYGEAKILPIAEEHEKNPICSYGITKLAIEKYIFLHQHLYDLEPVILRPSNPFGPRQGHLGSQGAIATFTDRIINKNPITLWGDGQIIRDYVYIKDLVDACRAAIRSSVTGIFNIGSGKGTTLTDIIRMIETCTGIKAKIEHNPPRNFDIQKIILDISKAEKYLNWAPSIDIESGIRLHCDWYIQNMNRTESKEPKGEMP